MLQDTNPQGIAKSSGVEQDLEAFVATELDGMRMSRFHTRVIALISAGLFFDLFDIVVFGAIVPDLLKTKFATPAGAALIASMTFIGLLVGSVGQGELTDRFGRKTVYQANLLIFGIATLASATSPNYLALAIWRFIAGIGLGAEIPLAYAYASEFSPKASRGRVLSLVNFFGATLAVPLSTLFVFATRQTIGWRGVFVFIGVAALIVFILRIGLPESPRWMANKGRVTDTLALLRRMGVSINASTRFVAKAKPRKIQDPLLSLFRRYPRRISAYMAAMFFANIGIYVMLTWLPTLLGKQGMNIEKSLVFSLVITSAFPISSLALMYLLDRFGRIRTILAGFMLAGLSAFAFRVVATPGVSPGLLLSVGFVMAFFIDIAGNTLILMSGELFPTSARSSGGGLGLGAGRAGGIAASYVVVLTLAHFGVPGVFTALGISLIAGMICTAFLDLEPAKLSLEAIAQED